jgi:TAT (twin-arginine translocation) pathway signal sequence
MNRRDFLKALSTVAAAAGLAPEILAATQQRIAGQDPDLPIEPDLVLRPVSGAWRRIDQEVPDLDGFPCALVIFGWVFTGFVIAARPPLRGDIARLQPDSSLVAKGTLWLLTETAGPDVRGRFHVSASSATPVSG